MIEIMKIKKGTPFRIPSVLSFVTIRGCLDTTWISISLFQNITFAAIPTQWWQVAWKKCRKPRG